MPKQAEEVTLGTDLVSFQVTTVYQKTVFSLYKHYKANIGFFFHLFLDFLIFLVLFAWFTLSVIDFRSNYRTFVILLPVNGRLHTDVKAF